MIFEASERYRDEEATLGRKKRSECAKRCEVPVAVSGPALRFQVNSVVPANVLNDGDREYQVKGTIANRRLPRITNNGPAPHPLRRHQVEAE
jgi:hypothetical protein